MTTERIALETRAARHAALADETRLRIVDLLYVGDASPAFLQHHLDIGSNLLAHHLTSLEDAGIIERHRSQGDRRRTYVSLVPGSLDVFSTPPTIAATRVLFVCTGNSARSQLAELLWNRASAVPAASGGTHPAPAVASGAIDVAARHGLSLTDARPRNLAEVSIAGQLVVTVCDSAFEELRDDARLHWSIGDPVDQGTQRAFDEAFAQIASRVENLAPYVVQKGIPK